MTACFVFLHMKFNTSLKYYSKIWVYVPKYLSNNIVTSIEGRTRLYIYYISTYQDYQACVLCSELLNYIHNVLVLHTYLIMIENWKIDIRNFV